MFNIFISVVSLIDSNQSFDVKKYELLDEYLFNNFKDYEIILINNGTRNNYYTIFSENKNAFHSQVIILNTTSIIDQDNAVICGLDHANGDYTVILPQEFIDQKEYIKILYEKTLSRFDIVQVMANKIKMPFFSKILNKIFYAIFRYLSGIKIDMRITDFKIISRRSLNSILQIREHSKFSKAIWGKIGYNSTVIDSDIIFIKPRKSMMEQIKKAFVALVSFTDFLNKLFFGLFIISFLFSLYVSVDILLVKYFGFDLFGVNQPYTKGHAFLVIMISGMFTLNWLFLSVMGLYLSNIYLESKKKPLYFLESIQKL